MLRCQRHHTMSGATNHTRGKKLTGLFQPHFIFKMIYKMGLGLKYPNDQFYNEICFSKHGINYHQLNTIKLHPNYGRILKSGILFENCYNFIIYLKCIQKL